MANEIKQNLQEVPKEVAQQSKESWVSRLKNKFKEMFSKKGPETPAEQAEVVAEVNKAVESGEISLSDVAKEAVEVVNGEVEKVKDGIKGLEKRLGGVVDNDSEEDPFKVMQEAQVGLLEDAKDQALTEITTASSEVGGEDSKMQAEEVVEAVAEVAEKEKNWEEMSQAEKCQNLNNRFRKSSYIDTSYGDGKKENLASVLGKQYEWSNKDSRGILQFQSCIESALPYQNAKDQWVENSNAPSLDELKGWVDQYEEVATEVQKTYDPVLKLNKSPALDFRKVDGIASEFLVKKLEHFVNTQNQRIDAQARRQEAEGVGKSEVASYKKDSLERADSLKYLLREARSFSSRPEVTSAWYVEIGKKMENVVATRIPDRDPFAPDSYKD